MTARSAVASYDAVVVGAGPNGTTAAALLARAGLSVLLVEAEEEPGGGCRTMELTLPGRRHDVCAAVHPMGVLSPVFRELGLAATGLKWIPAEFPLVHPLPDGRAVVLQRSLERTAESLGPDAGSWRRLFGPLADERFVQSLLHPLWDLRAGALGQRLRFGTVALRSLLTVANDRFTGAEARALLAGCAAHSALPLDRAGTASFGLVLALVAHVADWPAVAGGSGEVIHALLRIFARHGGVLETGRRIAHLGDLPSARAVLFDLNPRQVAAITDGALPPGYRRRLESFRMGAGVFKVDWALDGSIPWRSPECRRAMTVHVCGGFEDVLRSEWQVGRGIAPERPFVLVAQPSLVDPSRAPGGGHTGWAYCHVPNGCTLDLTERIEAAIERCAPGFRDRIQARHTISPAQLESHNATMIGGDIAGGANDLAQFLFRPVVRWNPYTTPNPKLFLCSSSTPPGGGVHGMCGFHAARAVLQRVFGRELTLSGRPA